MGSKPDQYGYMDERPNYPGKLALKDIKLNRGYIWHINSDPNTPGRTEYIQFLVVPTWRHQSIKIRYLTDGIENYCLVVDLNT